MKKFTHKKTTTEAITIKGLVSEDAKTIVYDDDGIDVEVDIIETLKLFANQDVDFKISVKTDEEIEE